jgi:hypothetical protein
MSVLTVRELEFLASLNTSWMRLYWNELARLLKGDDNPYDDRDEARFIAPQSGYPKDFIQISAANCWRWRQNSANTTDI